jgi:hypothetical protein
MAQALHRMLPLPSPLVERLPGEGFASKIERGRGADWMVYFWREVG